MPAKRLLSIRRRSDSSVLLLKGARLPPQVMTFTQISITYCPYPAKDSKVKKSIDIYYKYDHSIIHDSHFLSLSLTCAPVNNRPAVSLHGHTSVALQNVHRHTTHRRM